MVMVIKKDINTNTNYHIKNTIRHGHLKKYCLSICINLHSVCLKQLFSTPRRPILASEVPQESPLPEEGQHYILKAVSSLGAP